MKLAPSPLAALALAPLAASQTLTVVRVDHVYSHDVSSLGPTSGVPVESPTWDFGRVSAHSSSDFWMLDPLARVVEILVDGTVQVDWSAAVVGADPAGTHLDIVGPMWSAACGGACYLWGGYESGEIAPLEITGEIAFGETASFSSGTTLIPYDYVVDSRMDELYATSDWGWEAFIGLSGLGDSSTQLGDSETPSYADLVNLTVITEIDVLITMTSELEPIATIPYCAGSSNATGQAAELEAFGSPAAGSNWFAVRASHLPPGAAGVLFLADDFAPAGQSSLCVGGAIQRVGGVQVADAGGQAIFDGDLEAWSPGTTCYAQVVHRDPASGVAASDAVLVVVE